MIEAYKILNGLYDESVTHGILDLSRHHQARMNRGHNMKLYKNKARLNVRQKFFSIRIVDSWNDLPQRIIDSPSVKCFESRLDKYWEGQDMKYDFISTWKRKIRGRVETGSESDQTDEELDLSI